MKIGDPEVYREMYRGKKLKVYFNDGGILDGWLDGCYWDYEEAIDDFIPYDGKYDDGEEHLNLDFKPADRPPYCNYLISVVEEEIDHIEIIDPL
ncbi:MAG: hypothetical protein LUJ09_05375 [Firmicutes bacterium]|nr:hypothetical protein [Bacillota bacterium]